MVRSFLLKARRAGIWTLIAWTPVVYAQQTAVVRPSQPEPQAQKQVGTGAITGDVVDVATGRPVGGAIVVLENRPPGSSRATGSFAQVTSGRLPASAHQVPPTPAPTALIVGQVVDSHGTAVPEAVVQLSGPNFLQAAAASGRVLSDGDGRYFFANLPAGDYLLQASKGGYVGGAYGLRTAVDQGQLFSLAAGERWADAKLVLWKCAVVGGTVLDEADEPVVGVSVQALIKTIVGGRVQYGTVQSASWLVPTATTDDRGVFRLPQLVPGSYVVVVPSTQTTMPVAMLGTQDQMLRSEMSFAIRDVGSVGLPRTLPVGDFAVLTPSRVPLPPNTPVGERMAMYRTTYFPDAVKAPDSTLVSLGDGEERTDLTIRLRPVPAVTVSGRLVTPDGTPPPPMALRLVGDATIDVGDDGFETVTTMSDAVGRFVLLGVPAGDYVLKHASQIPSYASRQGRPTFWVVERLTVAAADLAGLTVTVRPALRVEGRIEFRSASGALQAVPPNYATANVVFEPPFGESGRFSLLATKSPSLTFSGVSAGGRFLVHLFELGGWVVKSVTIDGNDVTDRAFDLQTDTTSLIVTMTDQRSSLSGIVKDRNGVASPTALVLTFPVDPQRWSGYGLDPRIPRSAATSRTGSYKFEHLPPGGYFIAAIDGAEAENWTDPKTLAALSRRALKITIADGEQKTLDVTVPERR